MSSQYQNVIEFYRFIGLTDNDSIVVGKKHFRKAINTILDIPKFHGEEDIYITVNPIKEHRLKANVLRYNSCYSDIDFRNPDRALCEAENIMAIMDDYGFSYGLVFSGRGLQLYVPVKIDDLGMGEELNRVLNRSILRDYYLQGIVDRSLITNYATFLRLPGTINSKNGKMARILYHNFDPSIDYFTRNYEILLNEFKDFINTTILEREVEPTKFDFSHGAVRSLLLDRMIALDPQIISSVRLKRMDRELNSRLFPNLAVYVHGKEKKLMGAIEFVKRINGDPNNFLRWVERAREYLETGDDKKKVVFNAMSLKNWAEQHFGTDHFITRLAQSDFNRLKYHNGYYKFIESHLNYESLDQLRADMHRFVQENRNTAGFHWMLAETGVGKSTEFDKLIHTGSNVVSLVPYLMLKYNMKRGSVYTYDSVAFDHPQRNPLMCDMMDADLIVADEAHCLKTFRGISDEKAQKLDQLEAILNDMAEREKKPVFFLTSTPSVEQITDIENPKTSKFIGFLKKEHKKVSIHIIDEDSIHWAVSNHNKVMIFIDHKKEVQNAKNWLESYGIEHTIFTVTKNEDAREKQHIEQKMKETEKFVVIATSSMSSGINTPLDAIILTNRMMNQQTIYQVTGRVRIINKPDQVHPIYIVNQPTFRIPNWSDSMDLFEFVSPRVLITYISKLYKIVEIKDHSRSKVISFNRLKKSADLVNLIKSTKHISEFYSLPEVVAKKLYLIPVEVIHQIGESGWIDNVGWANISFKEIKKLSTDNIHPNGAKVKCRNPKYGYHDPVWHYFDPMELYKVVERHRNNKSFLRTLPKKVRKTIIEMFGTAFSDNI